MPRRPTLRDLAAAAGVSRSTASNAYNRPDQLSAESRERVLATAARIGYPGPSPAGSALRRGRAGALGVLLGDRLGYAFSDPAAAVFLDGLSEAVEDEGYALLVLPGARTGGGPAPEAVRTAVVDAVVAYSLADDDPAIAVVRDRGLPLVTVDQPALPGVAGVRVDDEAGARAVAEHVLGLGHRRPAVVAFELTADGREGPAGAERQRAATFTVTRDRLAGYRAAVEAAGLNWADVPVHECPHNAFLEGVRAIAELLPLGPTAVLAMSDELALGVVRGAADAGLTVPGDLTVTGFDDTTAAARAGLTTVRQPLRDKGVRVGEQLLALLAGETPSPQTLPTELVVRSSGAPPPAPRAGQRVGPGRP
ncbi:transcriptional regulator, LacI family [Geodermatophilus obscurus]|uniref:Transcriptional regulator, LacI family n=1 Tax=Geodermatophilus obscurus TaxID=1861 RepID=A0A1I5DSC5_9ACTN|nr:LacI family DNA-binding transcriptional regulator [Geodermatophilus obscurus]SFO02165.1 transcriptional regulator, LacI family [Geodermatophilus obscurus]